MNLHRLEIFHYVVRHRGISQAAQHMSYGIQQPAISHQITLLEQELGTILFHRRPFRLTPTGRLLSQVLTPALEEISRRVRHIQRTNLSRVRFAAEDSILKALLTPIMCLLHQIGPSSAFSLQEIRPEDVPKALLDNEVDLCLSPWMGSLPKGLASRAVRCCSLVLLVPESWPITSADDIWHSGAKLYPLIAPPPSHPLMKAFELGLASGDFDWPATITLDVTSATSAAVGAKFGVGVSLNLPELTCNEHVRVISLPGFLPVSVVAFWRPADTLRLSEFIGNIQSAIATV